MDAFINLSGTVLADDTYLCPRIYLSFKSGISIAVWQSDGYIYVNLPAIYLHDLADNFGVTADTVTADLPFKFNCVTLDDGYYAISSGETVTKKASQHKPQD